MIKVNLYDHEFSDRLPLETYVGKKLSFKGVVIKISKVFFDKYKDQYQVTVGSVYEKEHGFQFDHLNFLVGSSSLKNVSKFDVIKFDGVVKKYFARHKLQNLNNMIVYKKTFGLEDINGIQLTSKLPNDELSKWCKKRIMEYQLDTKKYLELPNDGSRERNIINDYLQKHLKERKENEH